IPSHRPQNHFTLKMTPLEIAHQKSRSESSRSFGHQRDFCNRANSSGLVEPTDSGQPSSRFSACTWLEAPAGRCAPWLLTRHSFCHQMVLFGELNHGGE
ncbi:hypothetical protein, partial [Rhizobium laguerreae]|uniref:hypothetical protein n=1 Tax=Rhizobium laguerreae TaxID=1076926 RepID=UPI001C916C34